jgi:hypothetical protein
MGATIGDRLARRAGPLVGRVGELALFGRMLSGELERNVLLVHGPGGIGKTELLRELAGIAERGGRPVRWIDARSLAPLPGALGTAMRDVTDRTVVFLDGFERMSAKANVLREEIVPALPADAIVVIAGRDSPDTGWSRAGWEHVTCVVALAGLTEAASVELLGEHGVPVEAARGIIRWTAGAPLALVLAAGAYRQHGRVTPEPDLLNTLVRMTAEAESDSGHFDALAVCAIARRTTSDLLRAALEPEADAEAAFAWLSALPFVDQVGDRVGDAVALHDAVRSAMRESVLGTGPARERHLRRRIADHLYRRSELGDRTVIADLAHLLRDPVVRWAYCWDGSSRYHADRARPGDADVLGAALTERGYGQWWQASEPYHRLAPRNVIVARDGHGSPVGYAVFLTPGSAPRALLRDDPFGAACLRFAQRVSDDGDAVVWRDSIDLSGGDADASGSALAMLNIAVALRSDVPNPRHAIVPLFQHNRRLHDFCLAVGGTVVPELDWNSDGHAMCAYWIDYGPGGLHAHQRDIVYRELGLPAPGADGVTPDDVREALESFMVSSVLARSPLATGVGVDRRADSVRTTLRAAVAGAFGAGAHEQQLRTILRKRYLEPGETPDATARTLALSRATYYRRLREAAARVADHLLAATR